MNKRTFLQAFIVYLQTAGISFKEKNDSIYLAQSNKRYFLEMVVNENGTFDALVTDLQNGTFAQRQQGEWVDANDLKSHLQSYLDILQTVG